MKPRIFLVCVLAAAAVPFSGWSDEPPPTEAEKPPKDPPAATQAIDPPISTPTFSAPAEPPSTNNAASAPTSMVLAPRLSGPAQEIIKLAGAGVPDEVIRTYIDGLSLAFSLNADQMIYLQSVHVPGSLTTAMLLHDKSLHDQALSAQAAPEVNSAALQSPPNPQPGIIHPPVEEEIPQNPVQIAYIPNRDYNPYGGWQFTADFGWYWQPYSWVGYPWGLVGLDEGRWWMHPRKGLVWSQGSQVRHSPPTALRQPAPPSPTAPVQAPKPGVQRFTTGRVQFTTGATHH